MAVYRIWLDEERATEINQLSYRSEGTRIKLLSALHERRAFVALGGPVMGMYVGAATPPLNPTDLTYVESKLGVPLQFLEVNDPVGFA